MLDVTARLSEFAANLKLANIPVAVRERACILAADSIGIGIRARHDTDLIEPLLRAVRGLCMDTGKASVLGDIDTYAPTASAMINGTLIHSLDFDDTHAAGALHPSAPTLAAALAAAEIEKSSGADVVVAIIAGYEVLCRLSKALKPGDQYDRGFHPSAINGAFGATAAAGRIMGLTPTQMENAFGIVLSITSGSMQFLENGAWTKAFQVGRAAAAGLFAARLAREGYLGAARAIEGKSGFLHSYSISADTEIAIAGLGNKWETMEVAIKPYPACRFAHSAMDAVIALRAEYDLKPEKVEEIICGLSRKAIDLVGSPIERKRLASTTVEGQFSAPFLVTVALIEGGMGWDSYKEHLGSAVLSEGMRKVSVIHDEKVEALFPDRFGASVEIRLSDGTVLQRFVHSPKGEPDNFVNDTEINNKFIGLVHPYIGDTSYQLLDQILDLENVKVPALLSSTRPVMRNFEQVAIRP